MKAIVVVLGVFLLLLVVGFVGMQQLKADQKEGSQSIRCPSCGHFIEVPHG